MTADSLPESEIELHVFVRVRLHDDHINERHLKITQPLLDRLQTALLENINVREFDIYQRLAHHHKSYAEDFELAHFAKGLDALISGRHDASLIGIRENSVPAKPFDDSVHQVDVSDNTALIKAIREGK